MTHLTIKQSSLRGTILIPSSKSHTMRAILFGTLGRGDTLIQNYLPSTDTNAMIQACQSFGAKIQVSANQLMIKGLNGQISMASDVIDAGNSGIILRFCTAIGALASHPVVITGDDTIKYQRPMQILLNGLSQLGVEVSSMRGDGYAPIIVKGPFKSHVATISGEDSQYVSALLIAAAFASKPIQLNVKNPGEKPWVALTLDWFDRLGIQYKNRDFTQFSLNGQSQFDGFDYKVPGDFSSAAFPIAAALITGSELTIKNLDMQDSQGDKALIFAFQKMGASISYDEGTQELHIGKTTCLHGTSIDVNDFIDAITILAVIGCYAEGETHLKNASIARSKECNRLHCIVTELKKMGANIDETDDGILVKKSVLKGAEVYSYHDHRMAMSLAIAGMGASGQTIIHSVECISKTYPTFMTDFKAIGAEMGEHS